jgi:hypothetical protein
MEKLKNEETALRFFQDISMDSPFFDKLISRYRKLASGNGGGENIFELTREELKKNIQALRSRVAETALGNEEHLKILAHLWYRSVTSPPFFLNGPLADGGLRQLFYIYYRQRLKKKKYPLISTSAMLSTLEGREPRYPRRFMEKCDKFINLSEIRGIIENVFHDDLKKINREARRCGTVFKQIAETPRLTYERLALLPEKSSEFRGLLHATLKKTRLALGSYRDDLPELKFLKNLKDLDIKDFASAFLENSENWLGEVKRVAGLAFDRPRLEHVFIELFEKLLSEGNLGEGDAAKISSFIRDLNNLPPGAEPEKRLPIPAEAARILLSPKPMRADDFDTLSYDFSPEFVSRAEKGEFDKILEGFPARPLIRGFIDPDWIPEEEPESPAGASAAQPKRVEETGSSGKTEAEKEEDRKRRRDKKDREKQEKRDKRESEAEEAAHEKEEKAKERREPHPRTQAAGENQKYGAQEAFPAGDRERAPGFKEDSSLPEGEPAGKPPAQLALEALEALRGVEDRSAPSFFIYSENLLSRLETLSDRLLELGDTGALYWLSKATDDFVFPADLARLLHLGLNFHPSFTRARRELEELLERLSEGAVFESAGKGRLAPLLAAAALRPAVLAPGHFIYGLVVKLAESFEDVPPLKELFACFQENILSASDDAYNLSVRELFYKEDASLIRKNLEERTRQFEYQAPRRSIGYQKAHVLWQEIIKGPSELRSLLNAAYLGEDIPELVEKIEHYRDEANIRSEISALTKKQKMREIVSSAKNSLVNRYTECLDMAEEWVKFHQSVGRKDGSRNLYFHDVLKEYSARAARALKSLSSFAPSGSSLLQEKLEELATFNLKPADLPPDDSRPLDFTPGTLFSGVYSYDPMADLRYRLTAVEDVAHGRDGHKPELEKLLETLSLEKPDLLKGFTLHLEKEELLIPHAFLSIHPHYLGFEHPEKIMTLKDLFEDALERYPRSSSNLLESLEDKLENLRLSGALPPDYSRDAAQKLKRIRNSLSELGEAEEAEEADVSDAPVESDRDKSLGDFTAAVLEAPFLERYASIRVALKEIGSEMEIRAALSRAAMETRLLALDKHLAAAELEPYREYASSLARDLEIKAAENLLSAMERFVSDGLELPPVPERIDLSSRLELFHEFLTESRKKGSPFERQRDQGATGFDFEALEKSENDWLRLERSPGDNGRNLDKTLSSLFERLGFPQDQMEIRAARFRGGAPHFLRVYRAQLSFNSPLPLYGDGERRACVLAASWAENPGPRDFLEYFKSAETAAKDEPSLFSPPSGSPLAGAALAPAVVLITPAVLSPGTREKILTLAKEEGANFLLLDRGLSAFAAALPGRNPAELREAFLQCAPIFGNCNPFLPPDSSGDSGGPSRESGDSPRPLFRGRGAHLRRLWDSRGPALFYGGRGYGRSAVLRRLAGDPSRHRPRDGQYILYKNGRDHASIAELLADALGPLGLEAEESSGDLKTDVLRLFSGKGASKLKRVLLLVDDADSLAERDVLLSHPGGRLLSALVEESGSAFRAILAGGRAVYRLAELSDSPLSALAAPARLGPLESGDASDILLKPLVALGLLPANASLPERVLNISGGRPGPLADFGAELVDSALSRPGSFPPVLLGDRDYVRAFKLGNTAGRARELFQASLNEHPLHRVLAYIVYTLGYRENESGGRHAVNSLPASSILPELLENRPGLSLDLDELAEILDEMTALSILAKDSAGYRLGVPDPKDLLPEDDNEIIEVLTGEAEDETRPPLLNRRSRRLASPFSSSLEFEEAGKRLLRPDPSLVSEGLNFAFPEPAPALDGLSLKGAFPAVLSFHDEERLFSGEAPLRYVFGTLMTGIGRAAPLLATLALARGFRAALLGFLPESSLHPEGAERILRALTPAAAKAGEPEGSPAAPLWLVAEIEGDPGEAGDLLLDGLRRRFPESPVRAILVVRSREDLDFFRLPSGCPPETSVVLEKWDRALTESLKHLERPGFPPPNPERLFKESRGWDFILSGLLEDPGFSGRYRELLENGRLLKGLFPADGSGLSRGSLNSGRSDGLLDLDGRFQSLEKAGLLVYRGGSPGAPAFFDPDFLVELGD